MSEQFPTASSSMTFPYEATNLLIEAAYGTKLMVMPVKLTTYKEVLALGVAPDQVERVGLAADALVEAHFDVQQRPLALYSGPWTGAVGLLVYSRVSVVEVRVHILLVDANHQGVGVGTDALRFVRKLAALLGAQCVTLSVLARAADLIAYYERRGFVQVPSHPSSDHVVLTASAIKNEA